MKKILNYFSEVKVELTKVVWPKKDEVVKLVSLILIICLIVGFYVGGLDYILTKGLEILITR